MRRQQGVRLAAMATPPRRMRGAVLLLLLFVATLASSAFLIGHFSADNAEALRSRQTRAALAAARDALLSYAVKYRDEEARKGRTRMYGYLPLPDLGSSRNNNIDPLCRDAAWRAREGCDANSPGGVSRDSDGLLPTMVGKLPWRTLGVGPLRDGHGECLWLMVSALHGRRNDTPTLNWDTPGQLDLVAVAADGGVRSSVNNPHQRPVAVLFAPGPPLPGQQRGASSRDDVAVCGGHYNAADYLDSLAAAGAAARNHLDGDNAASAFTGDGGDDADQPWPLHIRGPLFLNANEATPHPCHGADCRRLANDVGLPLSASMLFAALRSSALFRADINAMLDRIGRCLQDGLAAGTTAPPTPVIDAAPPDKIVGRLPADPCYDDQQTPAGYFGHYRDQLFYARARNGALRAVIDGQERNCAAVLLFSSQRREEAPPQLRATAAQRRDIANYLEGDNLVSFSGAGGRFVGAGRFERVSPQQPAHHDILRCIPASALFSVVGDAASAVYDPASGVLRLGVADAANSDDATETTTSSGAPGDANGVGTIVSYERSACVWSAPHRAGGVRVYFRLRFERIGEGFVFALVDGAANSGAVCGGGGDLLGYAGDGGGARAAVSAAKIGVEFDTAVDVRRNDPEQMAGHIAIVYWGEDASTDDDNTHAWPPTPTAGTPANPSSAPTQQGVAMAHLDVRDVARLIGKNLHLRIDISLTPQTLTLARLSSEVWLLRGDRFSNVIAALRDTSRSPRLRYANIDNAVSSHLRHTTLSQPWSGSLRTGFTTGVKAGQMPQDLRLDAIEVTWTP